MKGEASRGAPDAVRAPCEYLAEYDTNGNYLGPNWTKPTREEFQDIFHESQHPTQFVALLPELTTQFSTYLDDTSVAQIEWILGFQFNNNTNGNFKDKVRVEG